jgi:hypothetical protein
VSGEIREIAALQKRTLLAHRDGRRFGGLPSLLGHCGHEAIFGAQRSVANDPLQTSAADFCRDAHHPP